MCIKISLENSFLPLSFTYKAALDLSYLLAVLPSTVMMFASSLVSLSMIIQAHEL